MVLTEKQDFTHRTLHRARFVYIVSFDVAEAFDNIPHSALTKALEDFGIDWYIHRVVRNWPRERTLQVRLRVQERRHYSNVHKVSKGLPQGGVLSPLPWLTFFNAAAPGMERRRRQSGFKESSDDLATLKNPKVEWRR